MKSQKERKKKFFRYIMPGEDRLEKTKGLRKYRKKRERKKEKK